MFDSIFNKLGKISLEKPRISLLYIQVGTKCDVCDNEESGYVDLSAIVILWTIFGFTVGFLI